MISLSLLSLVSSLFAPVAGVLLYLGLHDHPRTTRVFDLSVFIMVPVLVLWHVIEHALHDSVLLTVSMFLLGLMLPLVIERLSHSLARHTDNMGLIAVLFGLVLHAFLEGMALIEFDTGFATAVVLHRLFVGVVIWWILRPRHGVILASLGIAGLLFFTAAGYIMGVYAFSPEDFEVGALYLYQVFVSGTLLHIVFHQGRSDHMHAE